MKKTMGELLMPSFDHYRSIGELARTLQYLLHTAADFRERGRWGSKGPAEQLAGYGGCTNSGNQPWHSGRLTSLSGRSHVTTWQQNHDGIYKCIMASLCGGSHADARWRRSKKINLQMTLKFPMAYQNQSDEREAWESVMALHGHKLPVPTLNNCHRAVNVLAAPELVIAREAITVKVNVAQRGEMRRYPDTHSSWDACFLCRCSAPKWNCRRETFAAFLLKTVKFYKSLKPKQ